MEGPIPEERPMTAKRQKILDKAFAQLRKSRAKIDPGVLSKIRRMIASSPEIMAKLGVGENLKPADVDMPLSTKQPPVAKEQAPKPQQRQQQRVQEEYEAVDQAKTMEVMAKLMALNPDGKEDIKLAIKKAGE